MDITISLNGAATDFINGTSAASEPSNVEERAFADYWQGRKERRYGIGYRSTLTAPVWVFNWIADYLEPLFAYGMEATDKEIKGARDLVTALAELGVRKPEMDGPTTLELIATGYLAEVAKVDTVETAPVGTAPVVVIPADDTVTVKCAGCGMTETAPVGTDLTASGWNIYRESAYKGLEWFCEWDCRTATLEYRGIYEPPVSASAEKAMRGK